MMTPAALLLVSHLLGAQVAGEAPPPAAPAPAPTLAQPDVQAAPPPVPRESALTTTPGLKKDEEKSPVPWKLITKIGAGAAYAGWVVAWGVMVPIGALGLVLLGLSTASAFAASGPAMVGGGAALMGLATVLGLVGLGAVTTGAGFGIATTVLQLLQPNKEAHEHGMSGFLPHTLLL